MSGVTKAGAINLMQPRKATGKPWWAILFVACFAALLACFPARSPELYVHLVSGRSLFNQGLFSPTWILDGMLYLQTAAFGMPAMVVAKALLLALACGALAWRAGRRSTGWALILAFSLSVLVLAHFMPLTPVTYSLVLAVGVLLATESMADSAVSQGLALSCALFWLALMHQADGRALVGWLLGLIVLLGGRFDRRAMRQGKTWMAELLPLFLWTFLGLPLIAFNPGGGFAWVFPAEFSLAGFNDSPTNHSPFAPALWDTVFANPSMLAYFPLVVAALASALVPGTVVGMRWRLPTLLLALLSLWSERWIPWLALVAGPCLALHLGLWVNGGGIGKNRLPPFWLTPTVCLLAAFLLVVAWPGWLQGVPYERRNAAVYLPPAAATASSTVADWIKQGKLPGDARGLHLRLNTLAAFSWYQPQLASDLLDAVDLVSLMNSREGVDQLAAFGKSGLAYLVITEPAPARMQMLLQGLQINASQLPLCLLDGPVLVVGLNPPGGNAAKKPGLGALVWTDLAFGSAASRLREAPPAPWPGPYPLQHAFAHARPGAEAGGLSAQGREYIFLADGKLRQAAEAGPRLVNAWLAGHCLALAGQSGLEAHWGMAPQLALHLSLEAVPGITGEAQLLLEALAGWRASVLPLPDEDTQRALLTLAMRSARASVALDPADGRSWMVVGEAALRLMNSTAERKGAAEFNEWRQLREAQAAFAFRKALLADPSLDLAHYSLAYVYSQMRLIDLEASHLRNGWKINQKRGAPPGAPAQRWQDRQAADDSRIRRAEGQVTSRLSAYATEKTGKSAIERARLALDMGLGKQALDELLASDISAFGAQGMALEVDMLLRLGRADEVIAWVNPDEHDGFLATDLYHWFRVKAAASLGRYDEACQEAVSLTQGQTRLAFPLAPSLALAVTRDGLDRLAAAQTIPLSAYQLIPPSNLDSQITGMLRRWSLEANGFAILGLLALEQGNPVEGRRSLQDALIHSPPVSSGAQALSFPARTLARQVLTLLEKSKGD